MGFSFSMEKVLNYRLLREQEKKDRLAKALSAEREEQERLILLGEELSGQNAVKYQGKIDLQNLAWQFSYRNMLAMELDRQQTILEQKKQEIDMRRQDLLEAHMQSQVLEKVRQKEKQAYMGEEKRLEQGELDEIGLGQYYRSRRTET